MTRTESPNSINTFKQCKRKYFYTYKLNLPRKETIATITGNIVHNALERFFQFNIEKLTKKNYDFMLKGHLMNLFNTQWTEALSRLLKLEDNKETIREYYQDSIFMLQNFIFDFLNNLSLKINGSTIQDAFNELKPKTELYLFSEEYNIQGFIDAILESNDEVYILDYKTSSRDNLSEEYNLQLAIYALLYEEKYKKTPKKVGLHFLRHGTKKFLEVNQELLEKAKKECELIHLNTKSNDIVDYDKNPGPLCKWKTGRCNFYKNCYEVKKLESYDEESLIQTGKKND